MSNKDELEPVTCDCCLKQRPAFDFGKYKGRSYCNDCIDEAKDMQMEIERDMEDYCHD